MQGYDDINKFKKATGVANYKILSEYNIDQALKKWNVIEKSRDSAVADAVVPQKCGMSEFQDIPQWRLNEQTMTVPPVSLVPISLPRDIQTSFISSELATSTANNIDAAASGDGHLFRSLFDVRKPQSDDVTNSDNQRDIPLKSLFRRTSSCP